MSCCRRRHAGSTRFTGVRRRRAGRGAAGVRSAQVGPLAAVAASGGRAGARGAAACVGRAGRRDRQVQVPSEEPPWERRAPLPVAPRPTPYAKDASFSHIQAEIIHQFFRFVV